MGTIFLNFIEETFVIILIYTCLVAIVKTDKFITKENKRIFFTAITLCIIVLLVNYTESCINDNVNLLNIRQIVSLTGYCTRPIIILFLIKLCMPQTKHIIWYVIVSINVLMYVTSPYTHLCVYFTEENLFNRGPLGYLVFIICACELLHITLDSFINHRKDSIQRWFLPPLCSLQIVYAVINDFESIELTYPSSLNQTLPIVMVLFYLFYHLQLAEQYEKEALQKQKLQLMISQIKPHFFFNTITTIQALCNIDPQKASDTLGVFSTYVRQNISTQTENLIPFDQELQHVKTFVDIELLRFPNIEVKYDLQTTDFDIVALSIQPLIENSIKHGIRSREHGIVSLATEKAKNSITITIEDNGIGFDVNTLDDLDNTHIGISNVRNRLEILQHANMKINSNSNGTKVIINVPRED